ncbi:hypothetical protein, partial [Spirosoma fluminis]
MKHLFTFLLLLTGWMSFSSAQAHTQLLEREARRDRPRTQLVPTPPKRTAAPAKVTLTLPTSNGRLAAATTQTFSYTGSIVTWTVPAGVTSLNIEARGAEGGDNLISDYRAGKGAILTGTVSVTPGQSLSILVGEQPDRVNDGGGGSFVVTGTDPLDPTPLVIAGGGGGSGNINDSDQKHGRASRGGGAGAGGGGAGGTDGQGGQSLSGLGAGGGLRTDGGGNSRFSGKAFINGGQGGLNNDDDFAGFGGGGAGSGILRAGGGGGYSGGGAGGDPSGSSGVGGGGGSFNAGTNPSSLTGASGQSGDGLVIISFIPSIRYVKQDGTGDGS